MNQKLRGISVLCSCLGVPALSCSLMHLDEFPGTACDPRAEAPCARAQARFPQDEADCVRYVCESGLCVPRQEVETCDDRDQNCNSFIDDDVVLETPSPLAGDFSAPVNIA
ncbi:MAG TPA: hypothetical protein VIM73_00525, partial [Polyangiaceae bacterium]